MTGQQLKNSILQEAIQGHLVPNVLEPGEKTGAELLQQILKERQDKEIEEKGNKAKKLTLSTIDEEPWELPEGWCWCKLGDLSDRLVGKTPERATAAYWKPGIIPWVSISDMKDYGVVVETKESVSELAEKDVFHSRISKKGSLIMSFKLTVGRTCILGIDAYHNEAITTFLLPQWLDALKMYLFWLLPFFTNSSESKDAVKGKTLNKDSINGTDIPLPPLSIQKAIVAKIEELFPLVDEYDKAAVELETLNMTLPEKLRKSVLQEAIHGTLVPNDIPEGEATGAEVLQQILKERQDKENKEKGKKAKKLTLSTIEEEHWDLPDGWCWTQIGDIFEHSAGKSLNSSKQSIGKVYPYLTTSNVYWDGINFEKVKEMAFTEEEYKKCSAIKNDILVCEGGDVGRSCIWTYDYTIGLQNHVHRLRAIKNVDVKFFYYVLRFYKANGIITAKGIGIGGFSANALKGLTVPLPPLSIQHRIVEKIEEVFSAIDKLQA